MSLFNVSRLGIEVNLPTGATYDALLVNTPEFPVGKVSFEFSKPTSAKITGIQKCAQFFLKVLFTTKGSDILNPSYGTNFPNLIVGSNTSSSAEYSASITSAVNDAVVQSKSILNDSTNDVASKLNSVIITSINSPTIDSIVISLRLITMAGETGSISLPSPLVSTAVYNG